MAKALQKQRPAVSRSQRRSTGSPRRKNRSYGRPPKMPPAMEAEFQEMVTAIVADVEAHVRLRQWDGLAKLLKFYNRHLGTRGAFWLHLALLVTVERKMEDVADPGTAAQWAQFAAVGYELLEAGPGIREAIAALVEAQKAHPAIGRFLAMGLDGTSEVVN